MENNNKGIVNYFAILMNTTIRALCLVTRTKSTRGLSLTQLPQQVRNPQLVQNREGDPHHLSAGVGQGPSRGRGRGKGRGVGGGGQGQRGRGRGRSRQGQGAATGRVRIEQMREAELEA